MRSNGQFVGEKRRIIAEAGNTWTVRLLSFALSFLLHCPSQIPCGSKAAPPSVTPVLAATSCSFCARSSRCQVSEPVFGGKPGAGSWAWASTPPLSARKLWPNRLRTTAVALQSRYQT